MSTPKLRQKKYEKVARRSEIQDHETGKNGC